MVTMEKMTQEVPTPKTKTSSMTMNTTSAVKLSGTSCGWKRWPAQQWEGVVRQTPAVSALLPRERGGGVAQARVPVTHPPVEP